MGAYRSSQRASKEHLCQRCSQVWRSCRRNSLSRNEEFQLRHCQVYEEDIGEQRTTMQTLLERDQQLNQLGEFGLDPSLVLYLPLWKKDGSSFMSDDAYGHLATVTGATWGSQGRTFDGVDDLIEANTVTTGGLFGGAH